MGGEIKSLKKFKTDDEKREFLKEICDNIFKKIENKFIDGIQDCK